MPVLRAVRRCPSGAPRQGTVLRTWEVLSSGAVTRDRKVAQLVQLPKQHKRQLGPWTSAEARRLLEPPAPSLIRFTPYVS